MPTCLMNLIFHGHSVYIHIYKKKNPPLRELCTVIVVIVFPTVDVVVGVVHTPCGVCRVR